MSDESAHLPMWVRRRDGSRVPFEADRISQALYVAAEALGAANAFTIRELTDAVVHFLAQQIWDGTPTTDDLAEQIAKFVRELGQPLLAKRYAELQQQPKSPARRQVTLALSGPESFAKDCSDAFLLEAVLSRDVAAAVRDGLLLRRSQESPTTLASLVLQTPRLAALPWWPALDDWRLCGGDRWIVESPEWLCTQHLHPGWTPHLYDSLLSLPTLSQRAVELHLNIAEAPRWSATSPTGPLFEADEDTSQERGAFLDGLIERWKAMETPHSPALAWHLHARSFQDEMQRRQLQTLIRQALLGRRVRFVFDRANGPIAFAEGLDRKAPGVLLDLGIDLVAFAQRPEIGGDGATLLQKLPTLVRMAVSAVAQKRNALRALPDAAPLQQRFLIERSTGTLTPLGLDEVTRAVTGTGPTRSPLALDFACKVMKTLREASRSSVLDVRVECPPVNLIGVALDQQLALAGALHARTGCATLVVSDANPDDLVDLLRRAWQATSVLRVSLQRADSAVQQGELPI